MTVTGALPLLDGVKADASLSPCGTYRYLLTRHWYEGIADPPIKHVAFVMLNPSSADADVDDRTIRKCQKFARAWGYNGISVLNLFALRATQPDELYHHPDPVGPANDDVIEAIVTGAGTGLVVVAWGQHGAHRSRGLIVLDRLRALGVPPMRLGPLTKGGHPGHPLYLKDTTTPEAA
jgi:hypothetical protein